MSFKIAVGLGNTGTEYIGTRHNIGRAAISNFAKSVGAQFSYEKYCAAKLSKVNVGGEQIWLAVLDGFMNESGINFKNVLKFLKLDISDAVVLYDDITLEVGGVKLTMGGSSGGHNGVGNIISVCGDTFARLRLGIGAKPYKSMDLADYVLQKIPDADALKIAQLAFPKANDALNILFRKGLSEAQNVVNRRIHNSDTLSAK